jgi:hypothetical protein
VASAEVAIRQVQVVDKKGEIRALIVWQCGPDILYADSMDGLFDASRRKRAPEWVVAQLTDLSPDKQFDYKGQQVGSSSESTSGEEQGYVPTADDDLPDFVQG